MTDDRFVAARRTALDDMAYTDAHHAGLWFDRYIIKQLKKGKSLKGEEKSPVSEQVNTTACIAFGELYQQFYARWTQTLADCGAHCRTATVQGRMVVGLGDESVLETSVALHQTYGVPYIPGSALKGLAARFVRERLAGTEGWEDGEAYQAIFGDTANAGYITFFDALYVPGSGRNGQALWPDVITVHHKEYYGNNGVPPADWDSPTPIPFLSATGCYTIALGAPPECEAWIALTFEILDHALCELGVGAKTSSGYGRLALAEIKAEPAAPDAEPADPATQAVEDLLRRINDLPVKRVASELNKYVQEWRELEVAQLLRRQVAQAILAKNRKAGREKNAQGKAWYKELVASLEEE